MPEINEDQPDDCNVEYNKNTYALSSTYKYARADTYNYTYTVNEAKKYTR